MKRLNFKLIPVSLYLALFIPGCVSVPRQPVVQQPYGIYHIVERGQTLYRIAKTYNIDVNQLMQVNQITDPTQIGKKRPPCRKKTPENPGEFAPSFSAPVCVQARTGRLSVLTIAPH